MKKLILILSILVATVAHAKADNFVTDVMVIGGTQSETNALKTQYQNQGWTVVNQDLNQGASGDYIYLLYKTDSDANPNATFISYFTWYSTYESQLYLAPGIMYYPVAYDGGSDFVASHGNLNNGTNGTPYYLYYTKEDNGGTDNPHLVKSITFDNNPEGAMPGIDLNFNCGGNAPEIYMHPNITQGWIFWQGNDTECMITGYDGPKAWITSYTVPTTHDGLYVISVASFSGFINLETLTFGSDSHVTQMPSMQGCTKFKNVKTAGYNYRTPNSITSIPDNAFVGTAIQQLTMPSVTQVGDYAFQHCFLSSVTFNQSNVQIGNYAFASITTNCTVSYPGSMNDWSPYVYAYSMRLVVNASDGSCGWCGNNHEINENYLYWTLVNAGGHLTIDWLWEGSPEYQIILTHNWNKNRVHSLTLNHVYTIQFEEFKDYTSLTSVTLPNSVTEIKGGAFYNCRTLKDLYFDGTEAQWNNVTKGGIWNAGVSSEYKEHWRCAVTFNANGHGTAPAPQTNLWSNESKATQPTNPAASGYVFTGWYTDAQCTTPWNFSTDIVLGDMTLYAGWDLEVEGLQGSGTAEDPYLISNNGEWIWFAQSVTNGTTYAGQTVKLAADITATVMAGSHTGENNYHAFSGTFDGDGHTITLALSGSGHGTALFYHLGDATLKNLKVQGSVTTIGYRPATFASIVNGNSTISNCWSTVAVLSTRANDWVDGGGFVGRVSSGASLNMTDCAFHGSVTFAPDATTGGGMVGYTQNNATVNLTNCLYSPSALTLNVSQYNPRVFVSGSVAGNLTNCYYNAVAAASVLANQGIDASEMSNEALVAALGPNWTITDGLVVPKWMRTFTKAIAGYGTGNGGWQLIASPVYTVNLADVPHLFENVYDLYYFDQTGGTNGKEWKNHKAHTATFTNFASGQGYLYANSGDVTLTFTGVPYDGNGEVTLTKDDGFEFTGWNLIGNPYPTAATINKPFYRMNESGTALSAQVEAYNSVAAMEGVFVQASTDNEKATFTPANNSKGGEKDAVPMLTFSLTRNRGEAIDNSIIRFDGGQSLAKFTLHKDDSRLYIQRGGTDYAIVTSKGQGEMPLNFKASENGTYTITVNLEGVEMEYLHLIDNMTGADIDLLAMPSYTFTAKTTDYESRFKLVFVAN